MYIPGRLSLGDVSFFFPVVTITLINFHLLFIPGQLYLDYVSITINYLLYCYTYNRIYAHIHTFENGTLFHSESCLSSIIYENDIIYESKQALFIMYTIR